MASLLNAIVEAMGTALIADAEGRVICVGSALQRVFEAAGETLPDRLPAGDCRRAARKPEGVRCDRLLGSGAERRHFRLRLRPLELFGQTYVGGRFEEVTGEQRWAERNRSAADRSEQLLSVVSDYIFSTDADGLIASFDARSRHGEALQPERLLGRHLWDAGRFVAHPDHPRVRPPRRRQRAPLRRCLWLSDEDAGGGRYLEINAIPLYDRHTDAFLGFLGSATDVTARVLAQTDAEAFQAQLSSALHRLEAKNRELSAALEAAQASDRAKSEFLAMMSHELRTPLNAIIGFSELIQTEAFGPIGNPKYADYMSDVLCSARRLLGTINDILDYANFQGGTMPLELVETEVAALVEEARRFVADQAGDRCVAVDIQLADRQTWRLDRRKVRQVLLNLLSNALKFSPETCDIAVTCALDPDLRLRLEVSDRGPGIPPTLLERVFEPFVQADARLARAHEGTGLGLPLSKAIVEAHGGVLELESRLGGGTIARVRLPQPSATA